MSRDINAEFGNIIKPISPEVVNPEWHCFVNDLMTAMKSISDDDAAAQLERRYNKLLNELFPLQDEVIFSGKIRIEQYEDNIPLPESLRSIMRRYPVQSDEYGEFYEVAGERLLLEGILVDSEDEDGGVLSLTAGFTFCAPDDKATPAYTLIAHPEDIIDVTFSQQNADDSIERLKYVHPGIYQEIDELLPMFSDVCEGFKKMRATPLLFPPTLRPEVISDIETMMSSRLYSEGARYTVHISGALHLFNDNGEVVSIESDHQSLEHVIFSHAVLQYDGSSHKPYAVFEVPIGNESLSVVCMVDIEDIMYIEEITKDLNAHLGKLALLLGESSYLPTDALSRTISEQLENMVLFPQDVDPYDDKSGAYLFPVPLFEQMRKEFGGNPTVDITSFADSHREEMIEIMRPVRMRRGRFSDEQGGLFGLDKGEYLEGMMSGIGAADFEDGGKKLVIWLDDAMITNGNGEVNDYFSRAPIFIPLEDDTDIVEVWYSKKDA